MKTLPQQQSSTSGLRYIASSAAAIALAVFAASFFTYANIIWNPGYYGEYGLVADNHSNFTVQSVVRGSPADRAGIKVGDRVDRPQTLHARLVLWGIAPRPGERIMLSVSQGSQRRTVALQARPLAPLSGTDRVLLALKFVWLFVFLAVSFVLVILRPSTMTWGFYLFGLNITFLFWPSYLFFSYIPAGWFVAMDIAQDILAPAGIIGFLLFGIRFPANARTGWRRLVESLAPFLFVALAINVIYIDLVGILIPSTTAVLYAVDVVTAAVFAVGTMACLNTYFRAYDLERRRIRWVIFGLVCGFAAAAASLLARTLGFIDATLSVIAILLLGTIALLITYFEGRGLEHQRIKWVVLGLICAFLAHVTQLTLGSNPSYQKLSQALEPLYVVLPLTVLYAVIRYRVIDVRFIASRSLAVGVIVAFIALIVVGIDWLFSTRLPNSRLEAAAYVGVALLVGFSLNAARQSIGKTIDFVFFRPWYRTQEEVGTLSDAMRRANSRADLYEPLTAGVAKAFALASVALFERDEDGGFVRIAAQGWPPGMIWHILSDDPLVARTDQGPRAIDLDALQWHEPDLPPGVARPTFMVPIIVSRRVSAMLLCGAHEIGTGLDPDEIRAMRRLCADAGLAYGRSPTAESGGTVFFDQHTEPLGA